MRVCPFKNLACKQVFLPFVVYENCKHISAIMPCLQELEIDLNLVFTNSKYPNLLQSFLRLHPSTYLIQIFLDLINLKNLVIAMMIITTSFTKSNLS